MTPDELKRDFIQQVVESGWLRLSVRLIIWSGQEPRSHWQLVGVFPTGIDTEEVHEAINAILHDPRYFGVCTECNERQPSGWMISDDLCQSCPSQHHQVLF